MNIRIDSPQTSMSELFFRTADRMRVDGCINALAHEGLSLALSCQHEALLDHYVQILLQRLRSNAPELDIEVYFPANSDSLISRFNEALASQSVRQATRSPNEAHAGQIWLVHDAQQLPEQELQLLARLIQNFPGANIRAILLMVGQTPSPESLSAFGRKLLRWEIEGPTEEQAQAALETARHEGQGDAMGLLLRRIGKLRPLPAAWSAEPAEHAEIPAPAIAAPLATQPAVPEPPKGRKLSLPAWKLPRWSLPQSLALTLPDRSALSLDDLRRRGPLLGAAVGALALSVLIMMWIQPASFGLKGKGRPSADNAEAAARAQTPITSVTAAPAAAAPVELPDPAAEGQAWVRTLPPTSFLVQHGTTSTYDKAQQLISSYPSLRESRIVAAYRPGEKLAHFVVVSGPYESVPRANERIGKKDIPNTSWVRSTQTLQQQLAAAAQTQESR